MTTPVEQALGSYRRRMTEAIAFDTHRYVKRLTNSRFTNVVSLNNST